MAIRYEIDYTAVEELEEKFKQIPDNVEQVINTYLHKDGVDQTSGDITNFIPVSNPNGRGVKRHAKFRKWWKDEKNNLGFTVKARGGAANKPRSYGYLVFPNEGRGPRNPLEQRFLERGLEKSVNPILEGLNEKVEEKIREDLS